MIVCLCRYHFVGRTYIYFFHRHIGSTIKKRQVLIITQIQRLQLVEHTAQVLQKRIPADIQCAQTVAPTPQIF